MFSVQEETLFYQNQSYESKNLIWNLLNNSWMMLNSVYIFKHFEEYRLELLSDNENKSEVYWNASYNEKLIDYIKISTAFEAFNKAILINEGVVVHKIDRKFNKELRKKQDEGEVALLKEFLKKNSTQIDWMAKRAKLEGFSYPLSTIQYSVTLNDTHQSIIGLDTRLVYELRKINRKRNKLHFYTDYKGAFSVYDHIAKWQYIKNVSLKVVKNELSKQQTILDSHNSLFCQTYFEED